jgi:hypothetical protein
VTTVSDILAGHDFGHNGARSISSSVCCDLFSFCECLSPLKKNPSYIEVDGFAELCLSCGVEDIFG